MRRTVARRAERSRSDFVCPVMSGRDWCGGPWGAGPSVRGRTLFVRAMSVSYGYCLHREWDGFGAFLCNRRAKVAGKFVKRSNELSEQSEERLAAQRKRAAVKSVQRMFKGQRRALESQARTASCRTSSNNQPSIASRKTCVINIIVSFVKKHPLRKYGLFYLYYIPIFMYYFFPYQSSIFLLFSCFFFFAIVNCAWHSFYFNFICYFFPITYLFTTYFLIQ